MCVIVGEFYQEDSTIHLLNFLQSSLLSYKDKLIEKRYSRLKPVKTSQ